MGLFRKFFGKSKKENSASSVRAIMGKFIEASFATLNNDAEKNKNEGMTILLYMFGAVDMLCQVKSVDENVTLTLFSSMLQNELGEYSNEEAQALLSAVVEASAQDRGQDVMKEGGEALRAWLVGSEPGAPFRLTEILMLNSK